MTNQLQLYQKKPAYPQNTGIDTAKCL